MLVNIIGFFIALIALQAKLERVPFDIPHAETEIVGGQFTEYSGKKLAFFRLLGDIEMVVGAGLIAAVFLGGFPGGLLPGPGLVHRQDRCSSSSCWPPCAPPPRRIRIDQMINFSWRWLAPLAVLQLFIVIIIKGNVIMSIKIAPFLPELLRSLFKKPATVKYPFEKDAGAQGFPRQRGLQPAPSASAA